MKEVYLIPKPHSMVPVEAGTITPDQFAGKTQAEIAKLPVWEGNRKCILEDFFEVKGDAPDEASELRIIIDGDASRIKYVGARMRTGEIVIRGNVDMHVGDEMAGGKIVVEGNADAFAGMQMRGGELIIKGSAGNYLGAAYRGEWRGMSGGKIVVEGNAGRDIGSWMRGGLITVKGDVGMFAAIHMGGGTIIVEGDAGPRLGAQMTGGMIVVLGSVKKVLPGFSYEGEVLNLSVAGIMLKGPFLKFTGDLAEDGVGTLFLLKEKNRDALYTM